MRGPHTDLLCPSVGHSLTTFRASHFVTAGHLVSLSSKDFEDWNHYKSDIHWGIMLVVVVCRYYSVPVWINSGVSVFLAILKLTGCDVLARNRTKVKLDNVNEGKSIEHLLIRPHRRTNTQKSKISSLPVQDFQIVPWAASKRGTPDNLKHGF